MIVLRAIVKHERDNSLRLVGALHDVFTVLRNLVDIAGSESRH